MVEVLFMMVMVIIKINLIKYFRFSDFCCEGWFYYTDLSYLEKFGILGNDSYDTTDWQLIHQVVQMELF